MTAVVKTIIAILLKITQQLYCHSVTLNQCNQLARELTVILFTSQSLQIWFKSHYIGDGDGDNAKRTNIIA